MWRVNLFTRFPLLKKLVMMRSFQFLVILPNLFFFYLFIIGGLFGTPVGNRNMIIVFVWIFWWFLLIAIMVPFGARIWCTICPLPFFGDWLQRRALIKVRTGKTVGLANRFWGLNKRWPKKLRNIWLQNFGFLGLGIFCAMLVTRPIVSVGVFVGMILLAAILALVYRLRSFCQYLCPISGFLSLYSMTSMIELRTVDKDVCLKCKSKSCLRGGENGWACPWFVYIGKMERNNYCGLCMECVKSCPNDNIALFARPFATSDLEIKGYDESWKAFIMLGLALVYSVVLLGPWGLIKEWANLGETGDWAGFGIFAGGTIFLTLVALPAVYGAVVALCRLVARTADISFKEFFLRYSYTLVPLGLLAWIAFSLPLIVVNGTYVINTLSDPLGFGWNLFGTAMIPWTPVYPEWVPAVQVVILLVGLAYSIICGFLVGKQFLPSPAAIYKSNIPLGVFNTLITIGFMRFFVG